MASAQKRARTESTSTVADGIELKSPLGSHPLMEALAEQRRLGILTDITFVVEGVQFKAHRNVLVASSDFMRSLICGDFKESSSPTVTLDEVASTVFACVLDFCYEGRCRVPDVAVLEDLILAAARFQVLELRTAAALGLQRHLSAANCMSLWSLAERLSLSDLAAAATQTAAEEFNIISKHAAFDSLPKSNLEALLQSESLHSTEEAIFCAVSLWLDAQTEAATPEVVASLMQHCRFALMPRQILQTIVNEDPHMQSVPAQKVLSEQLIEKAHGLDTPRTRPRIGKLGWVVDLVDEAHKDNVTVAGRKVTINNPSSVETCIVPFAEQPIATGRHEFRLKLVDDTQDQDSAGSGFGFVTLDALRSGEIDSEGGDGFWWLRRFETRVYSGLEHEALRLPMPVGAEVRMMLDMDAKEATFFIDGRELQCKATGINEPVLPCVMGYDKDPISIELMHF